MRVETLSLNAEIGPVQTAIEILSKSDNGLDLCRRLVHAEFMKGHCTGVQIFLLDRNSLLIDLASYGRVKEYQSGEISAWDETVMSQAVRTRKISGETTTTGSVIALPTEYSEVVTGVVVFNFSTNIEIQVVDEHLSQMLSRLLGIFLDAKGFSMRATNAPKSAKSEGESLSVQELTSRQVQIIRLIADGLTNAEIATKVLLSESTVRQETIRIFRILQCSGRSEAVVKARALGIIESVAQI